MIIKLCDRLHNMRTGDAWPEQKRRDKALETMEVYAPIAHRLGISNIKEELVDRSLHYLDPVGYETIRDLLNKHGDEFQHKVCHTIARHLAENGIPKATIRHRVKSIYGIYRKMYMQNKDFEEIYDIYAVRHHSGKRAGVLYGAGPDPRYVSSAAQPVQGLYFHPQTQRVPEPAHNGHRTGSHPL